MDMYCFEFWIFVYLGHDLWYKPLVIVIIITNIHIPCRLGTAIFVDKVKVQSEVYLSCRWTSSSLLSRSVNHEIQMPRNFPLKVSHRLQIWQDPRQPTRLPMYFFNVRGIEKAILSLSVWRPGRCTISQEKRIAKTELFSKIWSLCR